MRIVCFFWLYKENYLLPSLKIKNSCNATIMGAVNSPPPLGRDLKIILKHNN